MLKWRREKGSKQVQKGRKGEKGWKKEAGTEGKRERKGPIIIKTAFQ